MKDGILMQSPDFRHEQLLKHEREFLSERIKILDLRLSILKSSTASDCKTSLSHANYH
jgi:hypothetical protein